MERMKDALLRMVRAARKAKELDEALLKNGYNDTPYSYIYGEIADAIYGIVGEKTEQIQDSVTYTVLNTPIMCDERRAALLYYAYMQNNCPNYQPKQPKPNTMEPEEFRKLAAENGGYMSPEGDWT